MRVEKALDALVRQRAGFACEYCRMPQSLYEARFPIDHIIAQQHGGPTAPENLALSCYRCNTSKGPNISGIDPVTGRIVRLYHPRRDAWSEHFEWQGAILIGHTPRARATIAVLAINHPDYLAVRRSLMLEGLFPSK